MKIKHKLQWKFVLIMFISLFIGIMLMATSQGIYSYIHNMSAEETEKIFQESFYTVIQDIGFIVVVVLIFFLLSRNVIKRIEQLNSSIEQISRGNMKNICIDKHHDELGKLSKSIYGMAGMLDRSLENERAMVCNIAHDLRTPVTSIQGYAQLLEQSEELSLKNKQYVEIIKRKSEHLSEQIEELLEYSILQFEEKEYSFERLSLSSLVEQIFIDFIPQFDEIGMRFFLKGNEVPHMINCNQTLMIRLLENLINNAFRYGKKGKIIEALLSEDEFHIYLEIANYGSTLNEAQIKDIFEPFYQGEDAKEYTTESKGLGLAIASKIAVIHNAAIMVKCDEEAGRTAFILTFDKL